MKFDPVISRRACTVDPDHAALVAAANDGAALCTVVSIDGSFSRRCGAQVAVLPCGSVVGDLADTCLERELAAIAARITGPLTVRFGKNSPMIDFRLPCGGGLDILIDPFPDRLAIAKAIEDLEKRRETSLTLAANSGMVERRYMPSLTVFAYGEGSELDSFARLGQAAAINIEAVDKRDLTLGRAPDRKPPDRWSAVLLLFHDHEWELPLLTRALEGDAFFIGAQGGERARDARLKALESKGFGASQRARVKSPVGATSGSRTPQALALAALNDIVASYEKLHPHG